MERGSWRRAGQRRKRIEDGALISAGGEGVIAADDDERAAEVADVLLEALELEVGEI